MEKKPNEYECASCHNVYESGWTKEEAEAEAQRLFGKASKDWQGGSVLVCDNCFNDMHPNKHPEIVEKVKKHL